MTAVLLCTLTTQTITAPIVPVVNMTTLIVRILFVIHLLLLILHDQPTHDHDVFGPCPGKYLPLFVKMKLIPAKIVTIITQGFELPHVPST